MDRCWLGGAYGDALHAVLCATGFNICGLLRVIAKMGLTTATRLPLSAVALYVRLMPAGIRKAQKPVAS